jgi:hypothetical protein
MRAGAVRKAAHANDKNLARLPISRSPCKNLELERQTFTLSETELRGMVNEPAAVLGSSR